KKKKKKKKKKKLDSFSKYTISTKRAGGIIPKPISNAYGMENVIANWENLTRIPFLKILQANWAFIIAIVFTRRRRTRTGFRSLMASVNETRQHTLQGSPLPPRPFPSLPEMSEDSV
ncbi:hypothetical protein PanWU01x14_303160, partial [Parasponia andersonii]